MKYVLENGKEIRIPMAEIERLVNVLDIDQEEAIEIYLEDEGHLENEEQNELCAKAKGVKFITADKDVKEPKKEKAKREVAANPVKEDIIEKVSVLLNGFADDVVIENKGKIITFKIGDEDFKFDLTQKRKAKK